MSGGDFLAAKNRHVAEINRSIPMRYAVRYFGQKGAEGAIGDGSEIGYHFGGIGIVRISGRHNRPSTHLAIDERRSRSAPDEP